jgi:hypothetical protein
MKRPVGRPGFEDLRRVNLKMPGSLLERIKAALRPGETQNAWIRQAIETKLEAGK